MATSSVSVRSTVRSRFCTVRMLAWVSVVILVVSTVPLYAISLYNHPYYDDYNFSANVHAVWKETRSISAVLQTAVSSAKGVRNTWQGTYTGTLLSNVQPGVFSESLYFLTTFLLLTVFLVCFGWFLKVVFRDKLGLAASETVLLIALTLTLLVQFMPDPDEAFFWFNGGIGNTFIYSMMVLAFALGLRLEYGGGRIRQGLRMLALTALMVLLGGGSYGGGLFWTCLCMGLVLWAFVRKNGMRFVLLALFAVFLACFAYNLSAPGNAVRAGVIGFQTSPMMAVARAMYNGIAVGAGFIRLPLVAVTLLVFPFLMKAAQKSTWKFSHPWLVAAAGICLYCTQFAPPLFSGVGIGGGRIVNTYWQSFVVMWLLYAYYAAGCLVRRMKKVAAPAAHNGVRTGLVLAAVVLFAVGSLGYKLPNDTTYGLPNLAGGSAALSLLRGEAETYHREMVAREALLNDDANPIPTLTPLSVVPDIFMKDLLAEGALYDVRPALCEYYGKEAIRIAGEEESP